MRDERRQGERRKSPAYSMYAKDWLSSEDITLMPPEAEGLFIRLLNIAWDNKGLPVEEDAVKQLAGRKYARVWRRAWPSVQRKFIQRGDRLVNERQEHERAKQQARADKAQEAAQKRWSTCPDDANAPPKHMPEPPPPPEPEQSIAVASAIASALPKSKALVAPSATPPLSVGVVERRKPKALSVETIIENLRAVEEQTDRRATTDAQREVQAQVAFAYWAKRLGHTGALLDPKRQRVLVSRLSENRGNLSELLYAVDGALRDDWIMGRDAKSVKKYDGIETIFRDRAQVERLAQGMPGWREGKVHPMAEKYAA